MKETGEIVFVGLDLARTAGVAIMNEAMTKVKVFEVVGNPYEQLYVISQCVEGPAIWGIEELHIFRNAKTIRSLAERAGFIKWTIKGLCKEKVHMIPVSKARKLIGAKNKKAAQEAIQCKTLGTITDNHADAILVAMELARQVCSLKTLAIPAIEIVYPIGTSQA